jgi:signal transduction histidine kinase
VRIVDDGVGFVTGAPRKPGSFGLMGLRERVSMLQGAVRIDSAPGRGTVIDIELPLSEASP